MTRHPNAQLLFEYLQEAEENLAAIRAGAKPQELYKNSYLADDCTGYYAGHSYLAGWHLNGAFMSKWGAAMARYKSTIVEVVDLLGSDERAVAIIKERLEAIDGRSIDFTRVAIYRIVGKKIVEVLIHDDDQQSMDEFLERSAAGAQVPRTLGR
jgi:hypothetical protein